MGKRLTHEEFIERVQKIKPTVEVLSEYKGAYEKVYFRCKICGHEWEAQANSMLKGLSGCRKCADVYTANIRRKTTEWFITKAIQIHGMRYDYSKVNYTGIWNKIEIICNEHGSFF